VFLTKSVLGMLQEELVSFLRQKFPLFLAAWEDVSRWGEVRSLCV